MIDTVATGGFQFHVLVNGVLWSSHSQQYKATDSARDVMLASISQLQAGNLTELPEIRVRSHNELRIELDPSADLSVEIPAPPELPVSDGGVELVDFFDLVANPVDPSSVRTVVPANMTEAEIEMIGGAKATAAESKKPGHWLIDSTSTQDSEGRYRRFSLAWRGYCLLLLWRDKTALKIGVGS